MTGSRNQAFLFMAFGFALWASAFTLLYAVQGAGCAFGWHRSSFGSLSLLRLLLIAVWAAHMALLAWLNFYCWGMLRTASRTMPDVFLWRASAVLSAAAIAATAWIGLALLIPSPCR